MLVLINWLQDHSNVVRIQVKPNQEVKCNFFIHEDAIKDARR